MPVWHETTRALRESGELLVVGITQEQHPDRCRLYAQWQGLDWPILWDPFNLTGSSAVPVVLAVDEHGIVRADRFRPDELGAVLLEPAFPAPTGPAGTDRAEAPVHPGLLEEGGGSGPEAAVAGLLFGRGADGTAAAVDRAITGLEELAGEERPELLFRLGVAYRMRHDSAHARPGDFQRAVDSWSAALAADPSQYIWRRRIQQYGPRLDKPYPFYDWIEEARVDLRTAGEEPWPVRTPLCGAEVAAGTSALPANPGLHRAPDPHRRVPLDGEGLVQIEVGVVGHTGKPGAIVRAGNAARVHVSLRPDPAREVKWGDEAGPSVVWISSPRGWRLERNLYELRGEAGSAKARRIDFEVVPRGDKEEGPSHLLGHALYHVCVDDTGRCVYLRQDFRVPFR